MPAGSNGMAALIAVCTSTEAPSSSLLKSNCSVICADPMELTEVIESKPEIVVNCLSSGVATEEAMVSGLAPGKLAETTKVGKSTFGISATGSAL